uniref:Uncharacterized protein n=1 Tax=Anguilla anguilla TaxID=7936 RepID=A0A0E9QKC0_ANGAN
MCLYLLSTLFRTLLSEKCTLFIAVVYPSSNIFYTQCTVHGQNCETQQKK